MRILVLLTSLLFTLPSFATWELLNDKSQFHFVTTKKNDITEVNQFTKLQGTISVQGKITLAIDLMSADTNNTVRDNRIQQFLFQTDLFPKAIFTSQVNIQEINKLKVGETTQVNLAGEIGLHGFKEPVSAQVQVTKLSTGALQVSSLKPIIVKAKDFNLEEGIKKLQELANLPSIGKAVTITFSLEFSR